MSIQAHRARLRPEETSLKPLISLLKIHTECWLLIYGESQRMRNTHLNQTQKNFKPSERTNFEEDDDDYYRPFNEIIKIVFKILIYFSLFYLNTQEIYLKV